MEELRQLIHIWLGLAILAVYVYTGTYAALIVSASLLIVGAVVVNLCHLYICPVGLIRMESPLVGAGFLYYLASITLLFSYTKTLPSLIIITLIVFCIGDGMATLVGRLFGRHKLFSSKTLEGSLSMFFTSLLSLIVGGIPIKIALYAAFFGTLLELFSPINDNIFLPLSLPILLYIGYHIPFLIL